MNPLRTLLPCLLAGLASVATAQTAAPTKDWNAQYVLGPDSQEKANVPKGVVTKFRLDDSKTFPGYGRDWALYVPSQYDGKKEACLMVFQDGMGYVGPKGNWRVPTVVTGYNDLLSVYNGTTTTILTIPQGYYNVVNLGTTLQTLLRTVTGLGSLTVSPPDTQATPTGATVDVGYTIVTGGSPMAFSYAGNSDGQADQIGRANRLIGVNRAGAGFTPDILTTSVTTVIVNPQTTFTMGVPNFRYTDYVDIVSQTLTNYKDTKDSNSSIASPASVLGRIWLTEYPLSSQTSGNAWPQDGMWGMGPMTFVKNWEHPNWSQWSPNQAISSVDITLLDMFGFPLPWTSTLNTEWSATLTVTE